MKTNETIKRLPDAELKVMLEVWRAGAPVSRPELARRLTDCGWAPATLNSFLSRLVEKGFLRCERRGRGQGSVSLYAADVTEEAYRARESRSLLETLYGSSIKNFVASFCASQDVGDDELAELERLLGDLRRGRER